jgi:hypothetical protein
MARFGRKSIVSQEQQNNEFISQRKEKPQESYNGIILDICGAHNPKSKYYNESFYNGIFFIVGIKELCEVNAVYWRGGYDALRMIYGVDENIIGRGCIVHSKTSSKKDIMYGNLEIGIGVDNYYQDELCNTYISTSGFGGINVNPTSTIRNFINNKSQGPGETWFRFEK